MKMKEDGHLAIRPTRFWLHGCRMFLSHDFKQLTETKPMKKKTKMQKSSLFCSSNTISSLLAYLYTCPWL